MGFYEDARDGFAKDLLTQFGFKAVLVVPAVGVHDHVTGGFMPGADKTYAVTALNGSVKRGRAKELTDAKSRTVYLQASGLAIVPLPGHKLRAGGVDLEVIEVEPVAPGEVAVLYQLRVQHA